MQGPAGGADVEDALGRCEERLKRYPEAVARLTKAKDRDLTRVATFDRLARLLRSRLNKGEAADRIMDARVVKDGLIATNPRSGRAFLLRGLYRRDFKIPGGDEDLKQALAHAPEDPEILFDVAPVLPGAEAETRLVLQQQVFDPLVPGMPALVM